MFIKEKLTIADSLKQKYGAEVVYALRVIYASVDYAWRGTAN